MEMEQGAEGMAPRPTTLLSYLGLGLCMVHLEQVWNEYLPSLCLRVRIQFFFSLTQCYGHCTMH